MPNVTEYFTLTMMLFFFTGIERSGTFPTKTASHKNITRRRNFPETNLWLHAIYVL